jgi:hypothetical protein
VLDDATASPGGPPLVARQQDAAGIPCDRCAQGRPFSVAKAGSDFKPANLAVHRHEWSR